MKKIAVIGSGFSSLSAACYMAKAGHEVDIYEKNETIGGRARQLNTNGFTFDIGPTFYWMPDVFEKFFSDFGFSVSDFYQLERLDPGYKIYFGKDDTFQLPAALEKVYQSFEEIETGSSDFLQKFLEKAEYNYRVAMDKVVYKPGDSPLELIMPETIKRAPQFLYSLSHMVRNGVKDNRLQQVLEFPVLFLGAKPTDIPAFYCFMNYADIVLGTWYVKGGIYNIVKGLENLAKSLGVKIHTSSPVKHIETENGQVKGIRVKGKLRPTDIVISGADYHHTETLLEKKYRNYTERYWQKKVFAPSALLFYIGFNKKLKNISHHTLFFDADFERHARDIYDTPAWSEKPLFYASFPSISDEVIAPEGKEAAIVLIPIAPGLEDTPEIKEKYFRQVIERMEEMTGQQLKENILFHKSYSVSNFISDYHAYKGNAYGLSNILTQTAFLKPKIRNRKLKNLFYTGQLTVPGPGIPPAIISGKIAAELAISYLENERATN